MKVKRVPDLIIDKKHKINKFSSYCKLLKQ